MRQKSAPCDAACAQAGEVKKNAFAAAEGDCLPAPLPAFPAAPSADGGRAARDREVRRWIMERLREVAERCLQAVPPPERGKNADGVWKFDAAGAVRALNLMGKELGMFSERVEHMVNVHEQSLEELE